MHRNSKFAVLTRFITWFFTIRCVSSITPRVLTDWENMTFEEPTVRESGMVKDIDILWEDTIIASVLSSLLIYCWTSTLWNHGYIPAWTLVYCQCKFKVISNTGLRQRSFLIGCTISYVHWQLVQDEAVWMKWPLSWQRKKMVLQNVYQHVRINATLNPVFSHVKVTNQNENQHKCSLIAYSSYWQFSFIQHLETVWGSSTIFFQSDWPILFELLWGCFGIATFFYSRQILETTFILRKQMKTCHDNNTQHSNTNKLIFAYINCNNSCAGKRLKSLSAVKLWLPNSVLPKLPLPWNCSCYKALIV